MQIQTYDKPGNLNTWAADINAAHADAVKHATSAIGYAKTAGELLLKVKQKLPHGAFGAWLEANCSVSERQAQRYMSVAQGKPVSIREIVKSDTVSDLPVVAPRPAQKPELTIVAPVIPPEEEWTPLDEAQESISFLSEENDRLNDRLAVAAMDATDEERAAAAATMQELREENKRLHAMNKALVISRDGFQNQNAELIRQIKRQRREIDKLTGRKTA